MNFLTYFNLKVKCLTNKKLISNDPEELLRKSMVNMGENVYRDLPFTPPKEKFLKKIPFIVGEDKTELLVFEDNCGFHYRSTERFSKGQFEQLFKLGGGNLGYSKNMSVFIPKYSKK